MDKQLHTVNVKEIESMLETNIENGLTEEEVIKRREQYGENKLNETKPKTLFKRFIEQIADFMIIVLLVAAAISVFADPAHGWQEAIIILVIVILNAVLGVVQESKAEKSLEAIKKLSSPNAKVIRNGEQSVIPIEEIVPGDVVVIDAGDFMPADIRLVESFSLKVDESALTGEAVPVEKQTGIIEEEDVALGDRINTGFMSTVVTYGRGKGIVYATGMKTEMGKIANLLNETEFTQTPLQKSLAQLGKMLALIALAVSALVFLIGFLQGDDPVEMFMTAVSLAVAAIPEGLPAIVTIVLAVGMQNLVKQKAIMRKLPAVETLGSTNIICSDKTGTLTQNKMTIKKVYNNEELSSVVEMDDLDEHTTKLVNFGVLCNDTKVKKAANGYETIGDPTEIALIDLAINLNMDPIQILKSFKRLHELPFDSERKLMTTVNEIDGKIISITKGAPDVLFSRVTNIDINGEIRPFTEKDNQNLNETNISMANQALRVLAIGYKVLDHPDVQNLEQNELETSLTFIGLVGMIDPPREEAKDAIALCKKAGIKTIMITGDHKNTAVAIAKELGIIENAEEAISGAELDKIPDEEFNQVIEKYGVYARVSPENKVRIVKTWRGKHKVVAMTGDGVNDAPALKSADIGVAMGITGTEVAKGAADMVLTDDNFATIVNAVKEGRTIFSNIKKSIFYLLSCNIGEIFTILLGTLLFSYIFNETIGSPLSATQILWVNLVTDSLMAIALGLEKSEPNVMEQQPRDTTKSIFAGGLGFRIAFNGFLLGVISFVAFIIGYQISNGDTVVASTMTFMTLAFSQLFHGFTARSEELSIFKIGVFSNKFVIYAFLISGTLQLSTLLFPGLFNITRLTFIQALIVFGLSISRNVVNETIKLIKNRKH